MKVGISLSGGGIRGIAHAGILQALADRDIEISVVSGTSSGALIGALYCAGYSPEKILEFSRDNTLLSLIRPVIPSSGFASLGTLNQRLHSYIKEDSFEALDIPLYIAVTNMYKGRIDVFHEGPLIAVVEASCAIPVLFKPIEINGVVYTDGGVMNNMPADIIRDKCDFLIGANLIVNPDIEKKSLSSVIKIAKRTFELQAYSNTQNNLDICDLIISPKRLKSIGIFQLKNLDLIYEFGYRAAIDILDSNSELINNIKNAQ